MAGRAVRLTVVGSGTAAPHPTRVCSAHLVQTGDTTLLLDCGSGAVHRLRALDLPWSAITHIAITHFHPDHITDLVPLLFAFRYGQRPPRSEPLQLIGPVGLRDLVDRLAIAFGSWLHAPGYALHVLELAPGSDMQLAAGVRCRTLAVPHTAESMAYSIEADGRRLVYTGDTGYNEGVAQWAAGANVFLTECSLPDSMAIPSHLTPREAGAMAAIANPATLVLTHFYPPVEAVDIAAEVAEHFHGPVALATDGWFIDL